MKNNLARMIVGFSLLVLPLVVAGVVSAQTKITASAPVVVFTSGTSSIIRTATSTSSPTSTTVSPIMANGMKLACPITLSYMKAGNSGNNAADVTKLQFFLKNYEKADVAVNGMFDDKTLAAVLSFQTKYADTILKPWNATIPVGIVNITTAKKINQIACNAPMVLNPTEIAMISEFRKNMGAGPVAANGVATPSDIPQVNTASIPAPVVPGSANTANVSAPVAPVVPGTPTGPIAPTGPTLDMSGASSTGTGSSTPANGSAGGKFVRFLKNLF